MAITSITTSRHDNVTTVTAVSDLSGEVFFHWYMDGAFVGQSTSGQRTFLLENGDQVRIEVLDTNDADFDSIANAPAGWPARRSLWWVRSLDTDVVHYRIEQQQDAGAFVAVGQVSHADAEWSYSFLTPRLADLSAYTWRIIPVDLAGNDGTLLTVGPETIVRTPDAPNFAVAFSTPPPFVTFSEAA